MLRGQVGPVGVVAAVVADGVTFLKDPAQEPRVFLDLAADHEEGCLDVVLSQGGEDPERGARSGPSSRVSAILPPRSSSCRGSPDPAKNLRLPPRPRPPPCPTIKDQEVRGGSRPPPTRRAVRIPIRMMSRRRKARPTRKARTRPSTTAIRRAMKRRQRARLKAAERTFGIAFRSLPEACREPRLPDRNFALNGLPRVSYAMLPISEKLIVTRGTRVAPPDVVSDRERGLDIAGARANGCSGGTPASGSCVAQYGA